MFFRYKCIVILEKSTQLSTSYFIVKFHLNLS